MGMCGGFAVLANAGSKRIGLNGRFVAYSIGKTLSYGILGVSVGWFGAQLSDWKTGGVVLAWIAGLAMIAVAGHLLGWPLFARLNPPAASSGFVSRFAVLIKKDSLTSRLGMGVLNGFLPCGLVYAAVAMALSQGSAVHGVLFMVAFGLGTIPSLWVAAQFTTLFSGGWRVRLSRLSGWLVLVFGVYTILRGMGLLSALMSGGMNGHM